MGTAHDRIFPGSDLRDSFCLIVFPDGLVVLKLGGVFQDLCLSPRLVKPTQKPGMNVYSDLSFPMGIETIRPIFRNSVRRDQRRIIANDAQVEARRIKIVVGTNVDLRHVGQKLPPFDGTCNYPPFTNLFCIAAGTS